MTLAAGLSSSPAPSVLSVFQCEDEMSKQGSSKCQEIPDRKVQVTAVAVEHQDDHLRVDGREELSKSGKTGTAVDPLLSQRLIPGYGDTYTYRSVAAISSSSLCRAEKSIS